MRNREAADSLALPRAGGTSSAVGVGGAGEECAPVVTAVAAVVAILTAAFSAAGCGDEGEDRAVAPIAAPRLKEPQLASVHSRPLVDSRDILTADADGGQVRPLIRHGAAGVSPAFDGRSAWSPDGKKLAFAVQFGGTGLGRDIYVANSDGSNLRRLTNDGRSAEPAWSPDGRTIAFVHVTVSEEPTALPGDPPVYDPVGSAIWTMNASDGSDAGPLGSEEAEIFVGGPAFSPDGSEIAFSRATFRPEIGFRAGPLRDRLRRFGAAQARRPGRLSCLLPRREQDRVRQRPR